MLQKYTDLIKLHLQYLISERNLSAHTVRSYGSDLEQFFIFATEKGINSIEDMDHLFIREFLAALQKSGCKKRTVARKICSLRSFLSFAIPTDY